ncbi:response regulator transcription factor [Candidatus Fermentibacteria bacterium]|nr:response regulator transcription factor [Candidatus Fermentibacteria bacterium]
MSEGRAREVRIAVIDDERDILDLVDLHLRRAGFATSLFERSKPFLDSLGEGLPDLLVLDLMIPDIHGRDVLAALRSASRTARIPVIVLTALGSETDRIAGLDAGADDYLPKPFSPKELVARVKAVLRRTAAGEMKGMLELAGILKIDFDRFETSVAGTPVNLTATEFRLLRILAEGRGRVYSRQKLLEMLWEGEKFVFDRTIDVHITNLRAKLGQAGRLIRSVRGVGYRVSEE